MAAASSPDDITLDQNIFSDTNVLSDSNIGSGSDPDAAFNDDIDISYLDQKPQDPKLALSTNSCTSPSSPSRKRTRKRADECSASDPDKNQPSFVGLEDIVKEALQRKWCSASILAGSMSDPVCAFSGRREIAPNFFRVTGYLCEFSYLAHDALFHSQS